MRLFIQIGLIIQNAAILSIPDDYDDIVFDEWIDEYIHRDNGIYSDWYGYWLLNDNAVHVIVEIESDGDVDQYHDNYFHVDDDDIVDIDIDMQWYEFLSDKHPVWTEFSYILKSLMTSDLNNDWIPKQYAIEVYPIGEAKPNQYFLNYTKEALTNGLKQLNN